VSKRKWASDEDAGDLLAGILDETAMDAREEEERIQREIKAREEEERRKREQEDARRKQEAEARISAEMERQSVNAERRTQKMQALKIEELKERGEWIDPEIEAAKRRAEEEAQRKEAEALALAEARRAAAEARVASEATPGGAIAQPANDNSKLKYALGAVVALVLVAGLGIAGIASGSYEPDATSYSKVVYSPKTVQVAMVERGFTLIPKATPEPVVEDTRRPARTTRTVSRNTSPAAKAAPSPKTDAVGKKANQRASELEKMLQNAGDPFGL